MKAHEQRRMERELAHAMKLERILRWSAVAIPLLLLVVALVAYVTSSNACDASSTRRD